MLALDHARTTRKDKGVFGCNAFVPYGHPIQLHLTTIRSALPFAQHLVTTL